MITIKDSVHGHIDIDGIGLALLDTPPVQRLRYIRQLGTVHLVYPSANHTRFEHSLGVYHLIRRGLSTLGIAGQRATELEAAAMLHDIGHTPFSHNLEPVIERHTGRSHDAIAHLLEQPPIAPVLDEWGIDPQNVADLIDGHGQYGQLLSGELDVDRMDYLVRDAHHTGVPYGTIDPGRLLRELAIHDGSLALSAGNVQSAENLLIARALMNPTVYNHHVARISKTMLRRAVDRLLSDEDAPFDQAALTPWSAADLDVHPLRSVTDHDVLSTLRANATAEPLARRLLHRSLYKRAVWAERESVPAWLVEAEREDRLALEADIADRAGVASDAVLIDVPALPSMSEADANVRINGDTRRLADESPFVRQLQANNEAQWRLGVYAPPDDCSAVGSAAAEILGLDSSGSLVTEHTGGPHRNLTEFMNR